MLTNLTLNQFILFQNQEINFLENFTVITGESGSGKSMFIKALKFVLGDKFDFNENINVSAQFSLDNKKYFLNEILEENGIDIDENNLTIRRIQSPEGKGKILVNDNMVTNKFLKRIASLLVEFHSQQDQLETFRPENTLSIIDNFIGANDLILEVSHLYKDILNIQIEISSLEGETDKQAINIDYFKSCVDEISSLKLISGEEDLLIEKKRLVNQRAKILKLLNELQHNVDDDDSTLVSITKLQRELQKYSNLSNIEQKIENSIIALEELSIEIQETIDNFNFDGDIENLEERLSRIKELCRKYRCNTSDELIEKSIEFEANYNRALNLESLILDLKKKQAVIKKNYLDKALLLSQERQNTIKYIEKKITDEIFFLHLADVEIKFDFGSDPNNFSQKGIDSAKLLIKTNKGFNFQEISKIASGGELSRIMLALKVALANYNTKTIIFDEIDSGTGGIVAETIGNRLRKLANNNQIIAISHQPQVAARAYQHLLVSKQVKDMATSNITSLALKDRQREIAKMISGADITDAALEISSTLLSS